MGIISLLGRGPHFFRLKIMETTQSTPVQEVRARVNDKNLLATVQHLFKSSYSVLGELMQNARRAGASQVRFEFDPEKKTLLVCDNGKGIDDFGALIDLCTSGWSEDVMLKDNPFGMGFFSVFFACDHIKVRSRGLSLTACHADIVSKRALKVVEDKSPVHSGVILELHGLKETLLKHDSYFGGNNKRYVLCEKLKAYAMGFPIEVQINGEILPRPHAQSNLTGVMTPHGFIHVNHVHDAADSNALQAFRSGWALYLQGLPINGENKHSANRVAHLDSTRFTPQMPDRVHLRDGQEELDAMEQTAQGMVREFLAARKQVMDPKEFVLAYWSHCGSYGVKHLLNDIPFVPSDCFERFEGFEFHHRDRWSTYRRKEGNPVSMQDLAEGVITAWRDVPEEIEDSQHWAVIQLALSRNGILNLKTSGLDAGHWIFKQTRSCDDFEVTLTPIGETGKTANFYLADYECEIQLVDAVDVKITSKVDTAFLLEQRIDDDFVVIENPDAAEMRHSDHKLIVYAMTSGKHTDTPVNMFSSFEDENDRFDETWQSNAETEWTSIVNALRGLSLAKNLELGLGDLQISVAEEQVGHMAVVHATREWSGEGGSYSYQRLQVVDLEEAALWESFSCLLSKNAPMDANALKKAFATALGGVGFIGGPKATMA